MSDAIPRQQARAIARELKMYRALQRRDIDWSQLSRYHGEHATTLGPGHVFELIRDVDGQVAQTLDHWLNHRAAELNRDELLAALQELRRYLMHNRVITSTILARNLVWQRMNNRSPRLVVIDDIGNADFIPIRQVVPAMARNKIRRKWARFAAQLSADHGVEI